MASLIWFRSDLRTRDNLALSAACRERHEAVVGLFVVCAEQWKSHDWGGNRVAFVLQNLAALRRELDALNIPLRIISEPWFRGVPARIAKLLGELECDRLFFNNEYEINERRRDEAVEDLLTNEGRRVHRFDDRVIVAPGCVTKKDGGWYSVFSPFQRTWIEHLEEVGVPGSAPTLQKRSASQAKSDEIPERIRGFELSGLRTDLWPTGEHAAHDRLESFVDERIADYGEDRDLPGMNGTSLLSPYLASGAISPRDCLRAVMKKNNNSLKEKRGGSKGAAKWISELIWRDFYTHLIVAYPRLCMGRPFKPETDTVAWRYDEHDFERWQEGLTGIPIVDAAMRQLKRTGWMHNRLRMIVAMFLTKNLLIDWRWGERYFMQQLVDGDFASNNGGWQWSASTGTDAAPYFRIFNPMSQARKCDPDAYFIRKLVPELADLDPEVIHGESAGAVQARTASGYPEPMVDLKATRQRAIEAFQAV